MFQEGLSLLEWLQGEIEAIQAIDLTNIKEYIKMGKVKEGEKVVGNLTETEKKILALFLKLSNESDKVHEKAHESDSKQEGEKLHEESMILDSKYEFVKSFFWAVLNERLKVWGDELSLREDDQVVVLPKRKISLEEGFGELMGFGFGEPSPRAIIEMLKKRIRENTTKE